MLKVVLDYPKREEEKAIIRQNVRVGGMPTAQKVVKPAEILAARQLVREVYMDEKIEQYILNLVFATRSPGEFGLKSLAPLINTSWISYTRRVNRINTN